eukprot:762510-Hanusia_phi.AAC.5
MASKSLVDAIAEIFPEEILQPPPSEPLPSSETHDTSSCSCSSTYVDAHGTDSKRNCFYFPEAGLWFPLPSWDSCSDLDFSPADLNVWERPKPPAPLHLDMGMLNSSGGWSMGGIGGALTLPSERSSCSDGHSCPEDGGTASGEHLEYGSAEGQKFNKSQWSKEEHKRFLEGLQKFCPEVEREAEKDGKVSVGLGVGVAELISSYVQTRSPLQVRSHAQKYFLKKHRQGKKRKQADE